MTDNADINGDPIPPEASDDVAATESTSSMSSSSPPPLSGTATVAPDSPATSTNSPPGGQLVVNWFKEISLGATAATSLPQGAVTDSSGTSTDFPGTSTHSPGTSTHSPGTSTHSPGTSTYFPGKSTDSPGTSTDSPGTSTDSSGTSSGPPPAKKPKKKCNYSGSIRRDWDPMSYVPHGSASCITITRIKRDIQEFNKQPPVGIYALVRDSDMTKLDVLIVGPRGTPYQGGFFHFYVSFGDDYPFQPPRVKLMTTDSGKVRFNPNFYQSGKVCLSILHTWNGPQWTASQTLTSLLCSIQSLMTEEPYKNEPGYETMKATSREAKDYIDIIRHETLRAAVLDIVTGNTNCPKAFVDCVVKPEFVRQYGYYLESAMNKRSKTEMRDFLGGCQGPYDFEAIEGRLLKVKEGMEALFASSTSAIIKPTTFIDFGDHKVIGLLETSECSKEAEKREETEAAKTGIDEDWDFNALSDSDQSDLSDYDDDDENGVDGGHGDGDGVQSADAPSAER